MWGCISTDNAFIPNFSVGYTSMKSDVIVHLAQWQYWWWFWFSFLWGFYYLTANRVIRTRFLKFRPKIYTSFRSHGKWGDFLACIIPTIWCLNILTNSSFILRLMEWQNESSLFTIRVRARQWYWIYKFELRNLVDIVTVPKNIGTNRWVVSFGGAHETSNNYFHALKLRNQNTFFKKYWSDYMRVIARNINSLNYTLDYDNYKFNEFKIYNLAKFNLDASNIDNYKIKATPYFVSRNAKEFFFNVFFSEKTLWASVSEATNSLKLQFFFDKDGYDTLNKKTIDLENLINESNTTSLLVKPTARYTRMDTPKVSNIESSRFTKKAVSEVQPILINKTLLNLSTIAKNNDIIAVNFNLEKTIKKRLYNDQLFFVIKQKRYKIKKFIPLRTKYTKTEVGVKNSEIRFTDRPFLNKQSFISNLEFEATKLYQLLKKNKTRSEVFSVQLSRRLLRTRKTLVLPAHVNLTIVTNSYDVVHSWFLPGLGVKLDCVPGRSTHHTFYVDNVGFFYGQCAEICGRYHHHMPIRVCMLPYEHFFVWWQHFGLPKVLNTFNKTRYDADYSFKNFNW